MTAKKEHGRPLCDLITKLRADCSVTKSEPSILMSVLGSLWLQVLAFLRNPSAQLGALDGDLETGVDRRSVRIALWIQVPCCFLRYGGACEVFKVAQRCRVVLKASCSATLKLHRHQIRPGLLNQGPCVRGGRGFPKHVSGLGCRVGFPLPARERPRKNSRRIRIALHRG